MGMVLARSGGGRVSLARGIELMRAERWFDAHEALEDEWRERAGAGAGLPPGPRPRHGRLAPRRERQPAGLHAPAREGREAPRPYAPAHRGIDVSRVLGQVEAASARVAEGLLDLLPVRL